MKLKGKVAIVTGGAKGIGKAIVEAFSQEGARVVILDVEVELVKKVVSEIKSKGGETLSFKADVSSEESVKEAVKKTIDKFGSIDILVNNAGVMRPKKVEEMTEEDWEKTLAVNLKGCFLVSKSVIPVMKQKRSGRIINISSVAGRSGGIMVGADYSASKGGIIAFTKTLARELAPFGINVNAVAPGAVETDLLRNFTDEQRESLLKKIPLGRLGKPEDVANVVLFLASDSSDYITGQVIDVNGGLLM